MEKHNLPLGEVEQIEPGEISNLTTPTSIILTNEMPSTTPKKKQRVGGSLGALGFTTTNTNNSNNAGNASPGGRITRSTANNNVDPAGELGVVAIAAEETTEEDTSGEEEAEEEENSEVEVDNQDDEPYITVERSTEHGKVLRKITLKFIAHEKTMVKVEKRKINRKRKSPIWENELACQVFLTPSGTNLMKIPGM
jgi:hypothetical protein